MANTRKVIIISTIVVLCVIVFALMGAFINRVMVAPPVDATIDDGIERRSVEEVIQVNVLNGCGKRGLADHTKHYLRARNFDVVDIGNYSDTLDYSIIIDRVGDKSSAQKVAYAMGIADSLIKTEVDSSLFLRCSIVLGNDYVNLKPFNK